MLEVLINNPSDRKGEGKISGDTAYNGMFCWISGFDADGFTTLKVPYDSAQAVRALYPINKYYYPEDLSDTSDAVDKRTTGDTIVYYTGEGEYITDQFTSSTFGLLSVYWNAIEGGLSSSFGGKITSPGTTTSLATIGLANWKCFVATGNGSGGGTSKAGYLVGSSIGTFDGETDWGINGYVARVMGIYGADSADARLHVRLTGAPITKLTNNDL